MSTTKLLYASETSLTCGMDALASGTTSARASTAVDNSSNLYVDALVQFQFQTTSGSLGSNPAIYIYAYGLSRGGSNYSDNVTGSDANFTLPNPLNLRLVAAVAYNVASNTTLYAGPFSVALALGGLLPSKWGLVINNITGLAFSGSANQQVNNIASYTGINFSSV